MTLVEENVEVADKIAWSLKHKHPMVDVDELIQDARLGLCQAAERFDPEQNESFPGYAATRIVGACYDGIRSRSRGRGSDVSKYPVEIELTEHIVDATPRPDDDLYAKELRQLGYLAFDSIRGKARTILMLKYWEGLTQREIAAVIGCDPSRVHQILHQALAAIRYQVLRGIYASKRRAGVESKDSSSENTRRER